MQLRATSHEPRAAVSQRLATYDADEGRCVKCRRRLPRGGDSWCWQAHHVLRQQTLRRLVAPARIRDATYTVLLCRTCHMRHENLGVHDDARVPFERLPARVVDAVLELGPAAEDLLRRYHPPTDAAAVPRHETKDGSA